MARYLVNNPAGRGHAEVETGAAGGIGDANKIPNLDTNGRLTLSMLPVGVGPDLIQATSSEPLTAGDYVNRYDNGGVPSVRRADAATSRPAHGYVLASVALGVLTDVYSDGTNDQLAGLTGGVDYYLGANGAVTATVPTATGIKQYIGNAASATSIVTELSDPIILL